MKIKHSIIIPVYNEELALPTVLSQLSKIINNRFEVIVVDDGSRDRSTEIAKKFAVKLIKHEKNMGKGAAMRTGIYAAKGENIIFIDADNTYPLEAIADIAKLLDEYDMVIGVRETKGNINYLNRIGNFIFKSMLKYFYKSKVRDPLSGLYGIKTECLKQMQLTSYGFEIETEITIKAASMNLKAKEISIRYDERIGETKLNPFSDGFLILQKILTFMFVFNPKYSFVYPGLFFFCFSMLLFSILAFSPINLGNLRLDIHSLIFSCMAAIVGFQIMTFGLISKLYATTYKNIPADGFVNFIIKKKIWKAAAVVGMGFTLVGTFIIVQIFYLWIKSGFHPIMKLNSSIIALFLFIMGILIIFSSLFLSIFAKDIINREKQFNYYDQFQKIKGVEL